MTRIEYYNDFVSMLSRESSQIVTALNESSLFNDRYTAVKSGGQRRHPNDRSLYRWVDIKEKNVDKTIAFITLYYNEITPDTGNFHCQIGRLQFYNGDNSLHKYVGQSKGSEATQGTLTVDFSNAFDPEISLFNDNYSVSQVVKKFADFIKLQ